MDLSLRQSDPHPMICALRSSDGDVYVKSPGNDTQVVYVHIPMRPRFTELLMEQGLFISQS